MRTIQHIVISAFLALGLFAAELGGSASKPAWDWRDDDRIAMRLDSVSVRERLRIFREEECRGVSSTSRIVQTATFLIDDQRDPELFLPWELMERFLNRVQPGRETTAAIRARLEGRIRSFGWSPDAFWRQIDAGTASSIAFFTKSSLLVSCCFPMFR